MALNIFHSAPFWFGGSLNLWSYYIGSLVHCQGEISGPALYITGPLVYIASEVIAMATDKMRYTVSVDRELFQQIEDFRFERRFQTRSEATVELIRLGLEQLGKEQEHSKNL